MKKYLLNYLITLTMIATSIITFTSEKLRQDNVLFVFAIIWIILAVFYTIISTKNCLIYIHKND